MPKQDGAIGTLQRKTKYWESRKSTDVSAGLILNSYPPVPSWKLLLEPVATTFKDAQMVIIIIALVIEISFFFFNWFQTTVQFFSFFSFFFTESYVPESALLSWSEWSECSITCGYGGTQRRQKICIFGIYQLHSFSIIICVPIHILN